MKATLSFNLNDHEDRLAHKRALNGTNAYLAFHSIFSDVFRKRIKYGELDFDSENLLTEVQTEILEILEQYDIDMSDLD